MVTHGDLVTVGACSYDCTMGSGRCGELSGGSSVDVEGSAEKHKGDSALGRHPALKDRRGGRVRSSLAHEQQEGPDAPWDGQTGEEWLQRGGPQGPPGGGTRNRLHCPSANATWIARAPAPRQAFCHPSARVHRPGHGATEAGEQHVCLTPCPLFIPGAAHARP